MAYGYKSNECEIMIKDKTTIKEEYKSGGKNRQYVLDKAVKFLTAKLPISQGDRHHFLYKQ